MHHLASLWILRLKAHLNLYFPRKDFDLLRTAPQNGVGPRGQVASYSKLQATRTSTGISVSVDFMCVGKYWLHIQDFQHFPFMFSWRSCFHLQDVQEFRVHAFGRYLSHLKDFPIFIKRISRIFSPRLFQGHRCFRFPRFRTRFVETL